MEGNSYELDADSAESKKLMLHNALYRDASEGDFKASHGLLHIFERYGIHQLKLQGEALSVDTNAIEPFNGR